MKPFFDMSLLIAFGFLSLLLLLGVLLRAKIKFLQNFMVPACLTGGVIGFFILNTTGFPQVQPELYPALAYHFFTISFVCIGLRGMSKVDQSKGSATREMVRGSIWQAQMFHMSLCSQLILATGIVYLLNALTGQHYLESIGFLAAQGFAAGPGQAISTGLVWEKFGHSGMGQLGMTFAGVGFIVAFAIGVPLVRWGVRKGLNTYPVGSVPEEVKTGLLAPENRPCGLRQVTQNSNVDSLALQLALVLGAWMLGPRIGKYDKNGKPHAIPGHNLTAGALGVFILWFCWFGFNGGSSLSLATDEAMTLTGLVCFNTNLAAAVATCVTMIFTWLRYGKPDVSMTLNGSLAGLVAITAGCDAVSPFGAFIIGFVAGILVVLSVEFFDKIAKIDDPVGAVSVHFANGVWGTIAVGLFSNGGDGVGKGLFYGGGFAQLSTQLLGLITVDVYVVVVMFIIFKIIDKTIGLRVPAEVEIDGLDIHEHGLTSAYAGFSISDANAAAMVPNENTDLGEDDASKASAVQMNAAVPVVKEPAVIHDGIYDTGMHKVSIIAKLSKFDQLKTALNDLGVTGMTVTQVMGCGIQKGTTEKYRGVPVDSTLLPKIKVEVIVSKISVDAVVDAAKKALYTGHIGDGKIFVYNVTRVVKIRTGEEDFAALQDVE